MNAMSYVCVVKKKDMKNTQNLWTSKEDSIIREVMTTQYLDQPNGAKFSIIKRRLFSELNSKRNETAISNRWYNAVKHYNNNQKLDVKEVSIVELLKDFDKLGIKELELIKAYIDYKLK